MAKTFDELKDRAERWQRLQRELAAEFRCGTCLLLDGEWLARNNVTLLECGHLSDWIAERLS